MGNITHMKLTLPEQVNAIVDVVLGGSPFVKTYVEDIDGNITTNYAPNPLQAYTIPGAQEVAGLLSYLFLFLSGALFENLVIYTPNTVYQKNSVVRYGVIDYISINTTKTIPGTSPDWIIVRVNSLGPVGPKGQNQPITA
jgi:hypothetical protein